MATSQAGRGWAAIIAILGVFLLNGLLVSTVISYFDNRKEKWLKGDIKYSHFAPNSGLYVIIGGNDMVPGVVRQIFDRRHEPFVLIQTSRDVESFRRELFTLLPVNEQKRVVIYYGSRTSREDVSALKLAEASEVYILGEETRTDDIESYHDTMNMKCLELIKEACDARTMKSPLRCRLMFEYQTTFSVFQFYDAEKYASSNIEFRPFNYYEMWAQKVFVNTDVNKTSLGKSKYLPLEGLHTIDETSDKYIHLFVVGMSRIGIAMAIEAAHLAHYPNYERRNIRTRITLVDKNAAEEKDFFMGRFKELFALSHWRYGDVSDDCLTWEKSSMPDGFDYLGGDFLDVEWEFINGGAESPAVQHYMLSSCTRSAIVTVAICLPESNRSHAAALYLPKKLYESDSLLQVLVYNRYGSSIVDSLFSNDCHYPYRNKLKAFGMPEDCLSIDFLERSETIGDAVRGRYLQIKEMYMDKAEASLLKRKEPDAWSNGAEKERPRMFKGKSDVAAFWSDIYNGDTMWTKLRSAGYDGEMCMKLPEIFYAVEHNRWNIEQLLMNFRPLTKAEQDEVRNNPAKKEEFKGRMAHLNICSNEKLKELETAGVDVLARAYDKGLVELLPEIYEELKKKNIN